MDTYDRPELLPQYDITQVNVALWQGDLERPSFYLKFKNPLIANQFNDGLGSWAAILFDLDGDDKEDLRIETRNYTYTKNFSQPAASTKNCEARTWMNLDAGEDNVWLGFTVNQKCLGLPNKFRVQGYADHNSNDNQGFDYAPGSFATIDLGDYYNPKPKVVAPLPEMNANFGKSLSNYSSPPENLSSLASEVKKSVVTIECRNGTLGGTGSGWSAHAVMPSGSIYNSYVVTNFHVVSECISRGTVDLILSNGQRVLGNLAAWDPNNDIAGIYTTAQIPRLAWRGPTPIQGAWVGVLGSPIGLPGVLTTGIVSSVSASDYWITFTAPINPGNSGGPVFDSVGRVIGIATAKARDSEGFGIGQGTPLMCKVVMNCGYSSTISSGWTGIAIVPTINTNNNSTTQTTTFKRKSITCTKGNIVKKVKAINPKCPKGYKIKR
jgi:S1-C subfamily serine protease